MGTTTGPGWVLAHARQDFLAPARVSLQPLTIEEYPHLVLVGDIRLDEPSSLRKSLALSERPSDAELVLRAYCRWGRRCTDYLHGSFAFAILNQKDRALFGARDHIGLRPLVYSVERSKLWFGSDVKALLTDPELRQDADPVLVLAKYANLDHVFRGSTCFPRILKVPPGHCFEFRNGILTSSKYWPRVEDLSELADTDSLPHRVRDAVARSVSQSLDVRGGVGSHLSGGLDCTSVALIAQQQLQSMGRNLAVTAGWWPGNGSDAKYGELARLGSARQNFSEVPHATCSLSPEFVKEQLLEDVATQPTVMHLYEQRLKSAYSESSCDIVLSGWGGDEGISNFGAGALSEHLLRLRVGVLLREFRSMLKYRNRITLAMLQTQFAPLWQSKMPRPVGEDMPAYLMPLEEFLKLGGPRSDELRAYFREAAMLRLTKPCVRANILNKIEMGHLAARLESWSEIGARSGYEYRFPLLSREVLELALRVPATFFFKAPWPRYGYRRAMWDLPRRIRWSPTKSEPQRIRLLSKAVGAALDRIDPSEYANLSQRHVLEWMIGRISLMVASVD